MKRIFASSVMSVLISLTALYVAACDDPKADATPDGALPAASVPMPTPSATPTPSVMPTPVPTPSPAATPSATAMGSGDAGATDASAKPHAKK